MNQNHEYIVDYSNNNERIFNFFLKLMMLSIVPIEYALLYNGSLLRILLYFNYICAVFVFFIAIITNRNNTKSLLSVIFTIMITILCIIASGRAYTLSELGNTLNFLCLILFIYACIAMPGTRRNVKYFCIVNFASSMFYVLLFLFNPIYNYAGYLTLGYNNPNQTGVFLLLNALVLVISGQLWSKIYAKVANNIFLIIICYMIFQTGSRSCLAAVIVCFALSIFERRNLPKWFVIAIVISPLLFVSIYSYMYNQRIFLDVIILGKSIYSGRVAAYSLYLENFYQSPLLGDFYRFQLENLHNGYLAILASFGIIAFVAFVANTYRNIFTVMHGIDNKIAFCAFIAIMSSFFQMYGETMMTTGNYSVLIYTGLLYYICNYREGGRSVVVD